MEIFEIASYNNGVRAISLQTNKIYFGNTLIKCLYNLFQTELDNEKTIRIKGNYRLEDTLIPQSNTYFEIYGKLSLDNNINKYMIGTYAPIENIKIIGGEFDGNRSSNTGTDLIYFKNIRNSLFEKMNLHGGGRDGIVLDVDSQNNITRNCIAYDFVYPGSDGDAFNSRGIGNKYIDCEAYNNKGDGFLSKGSDNEYLRCKSHDNFGGYGFEITNETGGRTDKITNNKIIDCSAYNNALHGIVIEGALSNVPVYGHTVKNTILENNKKDGITLRKTYDNNIQVFVSKSGEKGIFLMEGSNKNTILGKSHDNGLVYKTCGVDIVDSFNNTINVEAYNNRLYGVRERSGNYNTIYSCKVYNNIEGQVLTIGKNTKNIGCTNQKSISWLYIIILAQIVWYFYDKKNMTSFYNKIYNNISKVLYVI